ncbi:MAG: hypothetical protein AAB276_02580 [Pseudomonadota bacterium]
MAASGNPPSLPPATLAGLQANAMSDRVAVRIIDASQNLQKNPSPVKIAGTVTEQNKDGSINVQTAKGIVQLALRDRGSLPIGTRIDIEIPAGHKPQQASISIDRMPSASQAPETITLTKTINSLEIKQNLSPESLDAVISDSKNQTLGATTYIVAEAPIAPDQLIRLTPTIIAATQNIANTTPEAQTTLINNLLLALSSLPASATNVLRANILGLLTRLIANNQFAASQPKLINNIQKMLQLPENKQILSYSVLEKINQSPPQDQIPLNLAKPLDGKIIGFMAQTPTTIMGTTNTPPLPSLAIPTPDNTSGTTPHTLAITTATPTDAKPVFIGQYLGTIGKDGQPILSLYPQTLLTPPPLPTPLSSTPLANAAQPLLFTLSITPTNFSAGSPVFLTLEQAVKPQAPHIGTTTAPSLLLQNWVESIATGDATWNSLQDIMTLLGHTNPAQTHSLLQMIPSPATQKDIHPLSLFFLSMLRSGDIENWMGTDTLSALRQNTKGLELLRILGAESHMLKQAETVPLPQDWRMLILPFAFQQHIQKTPIYYKNVPDEDAKDEERSRKSRRLRFLFDLNLTRMGGVQVDGFMQPDSSTQRLDIILRTKTPLSAPMQGQMKKIYAGAMDKSHIVGDLSFQFRPEQWVTLDTGATPTPSDTILV